MNIESITNFVPILVDIEKRTWVKGERNKGIFFLIYQNLSVGTLL